MIDKAVRYFDDQSEDTGVVIIDKYTSNLWILGIGWLGLHVERLEHNELDIPFPKINNLQPRFIFEDDKRLRLQRFEILSML